VGAYAATGTCGWVGPSKTRLDGPDISRLLDARTTYNVWIYDSELDGWWQPGEINTRVRLRPSSRVASNADESGHPRAGSAAINPSKRMEWAFGPGFNQVQQFFY
jgi:hypothetical protein